MPNDGSNGDALRAAQEADAAARVIDQAAPAASQSPSPGSTAAPGDAGLAAGPDYRQEAAELLRFVLALVVPYCRSLGEVWTRDAQTEFCAAAAPVMEKYGFTLGALKALPEIRLALVAVPLLVKSAECVRLEIEARRAAAARDVSPPAADVPRA